MTSTLNVALVYGGRSVEHDVSVISAKNIFNNINNNLYNVIPFGISKSGKWLLMSEVSADLTKGKPLQLILDASNPGFSENGDFIKIDVAFIILHGTDGEDGSIQGLFQSMNIPYVGSDVLGSSMAMNKIISKKIFNQEGIPTAKGVFVYKGGIKPEYSEVSETLGSPFIVKPANLGSSVGVSIVNSSGEYDNAIENSFKYDEALLIEEFIVGRELECAIIGNEEPQASPPGEVELQKDYKFYSFDAKYVDDKASICHIPAKLDKEIEEKIKKLSLRAYKALGCKDLSRVDLFLKTNGNVIINEINTLPGFTNISMYPKLCEQLDISYSELITKLINLSLERNEKLKELEKEYLSGLS